MVIMIVLLVVFVACVLLFVVELVRRTRRQYIEAAAKPLLEPGMTLKKYEHELAEFETIKIQWKGLWWRLLKHYWKRILFILFCLVVPPVGLVALIAWALNWERGMTHMIDNEFRKWKKDNNVQCKFDGWLDEKGNDRV